MGYINFNLKDTINLIGGEVDVIGSGKLVAAAGQLSEPHGPESGALALLREGQGRSQPGPARARTHAHTRMHAHKHTSTQPAPGGNSLPLPRAVSLHDQTTRPR